MEDKRLHYWDMTPQEREKIDEIENRLAIYRFILVGIMVLLALLVLR